MVWHPPTKPVMVRRNWCWKCWIRRCTPRLRSHSAWLQCGISANTPATVWAWHPGGIFRACWSSTRKVTKAMPKWRACYGEWRPRSMYGRYACWCGSWQRMTLPSWRSGMHGWAQPGSKKPCGNRSIRWALWRWFCCGRPSQGAPTMPGCYGLPAGRWGIRSAKGLPCWRFGMRQRRWVCRNGCWPDR